MVHYGALIVIAFGLVLDAVNLYWDVKRSICKAPSGIIFVPLIPYLIGVALLKYSGISWVTSILLFAGLFLVHVFSVFLLPFLIMIVLNMMHGRHYFDFTPYEKNQDRADA